MMESRLAKIILLDGSQLDFYITPEILTSDLLDMVASYLTLRDKEYFGISYMDATNHRNWLQLDKKVLDHDLPKKNNLLILFFRVKFYLESIALTKDKTAVELFYLQAKLSVFQNEIEISNDLIFELTALVVQSHHGDYKNDADALKILKSQTILPKSFLLSPSSVQKERRIIAYYKKCTSMNRGQCIVNYLSIIEKLNNYGVHYYEVKDKLNSKWYLGISFRGIGLYEISNKITPKKLFLWSKLENLYYRDRKFSIEVHENNLNQVKENTTADNSDSFNPVKVYAWFASIPSLCKSIWLMAVSQHQFYLDKKQNKDVLLQYKSLNDLATELTNSTKDTNTNLDIDNILINNDDTFSEKTQMLFLLKKKQEILNQQLNVKKTICDKIRMKQQDIVEMSKLISEDKSCIYSVVSMVNELKAMLNEFQQNKYSFQLILDEEFEIQKKIMFIALNLASDPTVTASVQKARREFYEKSKIKFSKLEQKKELEQKTIENGFNPNEIVPTNSKQTSKQVNYFNDDVITMFDSISPASIHRKDSYRRAQEQKLFLENNTNLVHKANRNINGRRVKNIWNEHNQQRENDNHLKVVNSDNVFVNNLYDVKNFKDEMLDIKSKSVSPSELIGNQNSNELVVCFDLSSSNDKLKKELSNVNCKYNPSLYQSECIENLNNQITEISLKDQMNNITLGLKKPTQRKNTSDSNMKLLADHNFYHISNKRNDFSSSSSSSQSNQKNINLAYREIYDAANRTGISNKTNFKYSQNNQNSRPYELTEFFNKYNSTKYRRGMNSSSNSLVSLNESSASPNEELNFTNSDKDLIRSNPDLNDGCSVQIIKKVYSNNSPKNLSNPVNSIGSNSKPKRLENQTSDFHLNNVSSSKKDMNSYSNNGSLNLSIHTAEEFSIEMLSWLKNEANSNCVKKIINEENLDQIDNATLV